MDQELGTLSEIIRAYLQYKRIFIKDLATKAGVSVNTIKRGLRGKLLRVRNLDLLAVAMEMPPYSLRNFAPLAPPRPTLLSEAIYYLMDLANWNQADLARKAGIAMSTLCRTMRGEAPPSFENLKKIISAFQTELGEEASQILMPFAERLNPAATNSGRTTSVHDPNDAQHDEASSFPKIKQTELFITKVGIEPGVFGSMLQSLRLYASPTEDELSPANLAEALGILTIQVIRLERGTLKPTLEIINAIVDYFFGNEPPEVQAVERAQLRTAAGFAPTENLDPNSRDHFHLTSGLAGTWLLSPARNRPGRSEIT